MIIAIFLWLCNTGNTLSFKDSFNCGNHFRNQSWSRIMFAESGLHQWVIWGLICGAKGASGKNKTKLWCFRCDSFLPELIVTLLWKIWAHHCAVWLTRRGADSALTSPAQGLSEQGKGGQRAALGSCVPACHLSHSPVPPPGMGPGSSGLGQGFACCRIHEMTCPKSSHVWGILIKPQ